MPIRTAAAVVASFAAAAVVASFAAAAFAVPDAVTYQGLFQVNGQPFTGDANIQVALFDGNTEITDFDFDEVAIVDGLFSIDIDLPPLVLDGRDLDLEFRIEAPADSGSTITLKPRQPITTAPYAFHANTAVSADNAGFAASAASASNANFANSAASADVASTAAFANNAGTLDTPATISSLGLNTDPTVSIRREDQFAGPPALFITAGPDIVISHPSAALEVESSRNDAAATFIGRQNSVVASLNDFSLNGAVGMVTQVISTNPPKAASQVAFRAFHTTNNHQADLGTADYAADLTGNARIEGEFTRPYSDTDPREDLLHPIAYGFIDADGTALSGTPNFSSIYNPNITAEWYEIIIENEPYFFGDYVTVVTPVEPGVSIRTSSASGRLLVLATDAAGNQVPARFQFVTYRPTDLTPRLPARPAIAPLPAGTQPDN